MSAHPTPSYRRRVLGSLAAGTLLAGVARAHAAGALCGPTGSSTAGPFYVRNAPQTTQINRHGLPGTPMQVSGTIYGGTDGRQPLAGAVIEIWHCDAAGQYHPNGSGELADYLATDVDLRGIGLSDAEGRYRFDSIVPAHYGNRRRHIHWRIVAPGHRPLVTQSYWLEEKGTARERRDFVDRNVEDCRWVRFDTDAAGVAVGRFDIVLVALA